MGGFMKGDVVVLPFPFSDLSKSKKRPALVVAPLDIHEDVILCMITSHTSDEDAIDLHQSDFTDGGLPRDSFIRPNRLFTAEGSLVIRIAGRVTESKMDEVREKIIDIISR